MNNTQLIQRLQSYLDDPEWPDCVVVSKDTLRAAIAALSGDPVATVLRGGLERLGKATMLVRWEAGANELPDGEHALYAAPTGDA